MDYKEWLDNERLPIDIWENKYQFQDEDIERWFDRVSGGNEKVKQAIKNKQFIFAGRILANRGTGKKASMMNCYSRGFVGDSLDDIMDANKELALTYKAQGGQGISLSKIRPKGTLIAGNQFESDGIIPFVELFNQTTASTVQGGGRKGALLMSLDIWHKEAPDFIKIKSQVGKIEKANLSLEIDDNFMLSVRKYYRTGEEEIITVKQEYASGSIEYEVCPIKLYKLMIQQAYDWGEPGCIFTDEFRNYNLMEFRDDYQIETCNPLTF